MSSCFTLNQHRQLQGKGCIALSHLFKKNWTLPTFSPSHHIFMYLETQTLRPGRIIAFGASLRRNCGPRSKGSWIFFQAVGREQTSAGSLSSLPNLHLSILLITQSITCCPSLHPDGQNRKSNKHPLPGPWCLQDSHAYSSLLRGQTFLSIAGNRQTN